MDLITLVETIGEAPAAAMLGLATGVVFGVSAQRSRFCLRAATVEFARGMLGPRVAVWLLCFSTALVWVQAAELTGLFRSTEARMMAVPGSWSGALIGGLIFGGGMVLARGCPGRLLVLASSGNLRSIVSGLIFAVVAQMSLHGILAPLRDRLAALSVTAGGHNLNLIDWAGLPQASGLILGLGFAALAIVLAWRNRIGLSPLIFGSGVGFSVALGWVSTHALAQISFDPVTISSVTFSGPSAATLMFFLEPRRVLGFDIGLVPGVVLGAGLSALLSGQFRFEGFDGASSMRRAMTGAVLMGFGAMLAGGCAIGAGVSGGSIFAGTAWLALCAMWAGAILADTLLDRPARVAHA
ncbi:sulfur transporter [Albidovulum inexpectatum]|uniref:Sulfur transporter n=1 Tax=Albidovulum inexpectatum TaxID=196587 RepID=A0A2S5JGG2_9RHOB|nr:YeeE/YedE family protein [Albidovulum inexpectatum]PPB80596.1 sulfur transporter [Albidovulum inexpectatum]